MSVSKVEWFQACTLDEIPKRGAVRIANGSKTIALFKTSSNELHAIDNACPHKGGPLSDGIVHGNCVTCPLHNWQINLESGEVVGSDVGQVTTYRVQVVQEKVYVEMSKHSEIA